MTSILQTPQSQATLGLALGVASHWTYFIHGEHHLQAPILFLLACLGPIGLVAWLSLGAQVSVTAAIATSSWVFGSFFAGLFASIATYRLFFHQLCRFPGPRLASISKLYHAYRCGQTNNYQILADLHQTYGPVVRVGPNELSVLHPAAVPAIYGNQSQCKKATWYDMGHPTKSLHQSRDVAAHAQRRKIWDKGFSMKALRDFEQRVYVYLKQLDETVYAGKGKAVNVSQLFNFFSFDVMGDLAFGASFDMLKDNKEHFAMQILHEGQQHLSWLIPIPWVGLILRALPGVLESERRFLKWCMDQVEKRRKTAMENPDVMTWLLDAESNAQGRIWGDHWLAGDSRLIIVAGSDTTAVTLAYIFQYLARYPEQVEKLRLALDPILSGVDQVQDSLLQKVEELNGFIHEVLRMHPPVPAGLLRITPPEGIQVDDIHIPGGCTVSVPSQPIGRAATAYKDADQFIPERWYSRPELILDKSAFSPFSLGRYSCIGKNFAYMELRTVTALLVHKYDVRFAPNEDGSRLMKEDQDAFTLFIKELNLVFTERKHD